MKCAACLAYQTETDAVSVVQGTEFCAPHAVQALSLATSGRRGPIAPMAPLAQFSPPTPPVAPEPE